MCHFCITHGSDGGRWYELARNYAAKMYKYQKEEARKKRADYIEKKRAEVMKMRDEGTVVDSGDGWYFDNKGEFHLMPGARIDLDIMLSDLAQDVIDARHLSLDTLPQIQQKSKSFMDKYHTMQVVSYDEAKQIMDMAWPIGLMECICRRERRGMYNDPKAHTCFALGVGLYKFERWPETFRGLTFLSVKEAKQRLEALHRKGCVHALTTFYTPYIGGLCSCEYPTCLGIRGRVDYQLDGIFYKGHEVAIPEMELCTGCGDCVQYCQFGALSVSRSRNKLTVNMHKCYGCGQCAEHCPNSAIRMQARSKTAGLQDSW